MRKDHPLLINIEGVEPYRLTTGDSLYKIKPPPMQIDQFLPVGGVMGMTSYPGVGKTWLALEIARAVTSGTPFLGRYRSTRGGVLFVGSDSSIYDYARQWTRLTRKTPKAGVVYEPVRFLVQSSFMLEDRDEIRRLIRTHQQFEWGEATETDDGPMREKGFHVIVIDTLSRTTRANQNDNTEMEEVFRNIRWLSEATDCAIVLLHHNSKKSEWNDGADWRGAMSQIGALDSWVQLVPSRKDKHLVGVQYKKFRGITPEDFAFRMAVMDPETASLTMTDEPVTMAQKMLFDPLAEDVKKNVKEQPGRRACEIRDTLWPKYSVGVDAGGQTLSFPHEKKLLDAVNNRLAAMLYKGQVIRRQTQEGKSVYDPVEEKRQSTSTPAKQATEVSTSKGSMSKRPRVRKKAAASRRTVSRRK